MNKLDKIRQILKEQEESNRPTQQNAGPSAVFPFWKTDIGETTTVRFLPDGDTSNPLMWVENQVINLSFDGIKGQPPKEIVFNVPCMEMWKKACPVLGYIRENKWFDDEDTKALGSKYWKKRSWIFQGFVVDTNVQEDETPENPIRRFVIRKQLFDLIRTGFADPDLEYSPDDFDNGTDFLIKKTQQAGTKFGNYNSSGFRRKSRSLSQEERDAIEEFGLSKLSDFQPKMPTDSELETIFEMFQASVNGDYYDPDRFGHLPWRPYGLDKNTTTPKATESKPTVTVSKPVVEKEEVVETVPSSKSEQVSAADILAKIRKTNSQ